MNGAGAAGMPPEPCEGGRCSDGSREIDVAQLERLLAMFGFALADLAALLGVDEDELDSTNVRLEDLERLGIPLSALVLLGITVGILELIGIET